MQIAKLVSDHQGFLCWSVWTGSASRAPSSERIKDPTEGLLIESNKLSLAEDLRALDHFREGPR